MAGLALALSLLPTDRFSFLALSILDKADQTDPVLFFPPFGIKVQMVWSEAPGMYIQT